MNAQVNFQGKSPVYAPNGAQMRGGVSTASIKRAPTKRLASSICMYMPATVSTHNSQNMVKLKLVVQLQLQSQHIKDIKMVQVSLVQWNLYNENASPTIKENLKAMGKKALDVALPGAKA